jgi:hypothetical protein
MSSSLLPHQSNYKPKHNICTIYTQCISLSNRYFAQNNGFQNEGITEIEISYSDININEYKISYNYSYLVIANR